MVLLRAFTWIDAHLVEVALPLLYLLNKLGQIVVLVLVLPDGTSDFIVPFLYLAIL